MFNRSNKHIQILRIVKITTNGLPNPYTFYAIPHLSIKNPPLTNERCNQPYLTIQTQPKATEDKNGSNCGS